jgi:hypothetical protein
MLEVTFIVEDANWVVVSTSPDGINRDGHTQQGQASNTAPSQIDVSGVL